LEITTESVSGNHAWAVIPFMGFAVVADDKPGVSGLYVFPATAKFNNVTLSATIINGRIMRSSFSWTA
jgi:hypothetical protein